MLSDEQIGAMVASIECWAWYRTHESIESIIRRHLQAAGGDDRLTRAAYDELIYAVATKYEGETRHETALRYIRERESRPAETAKAAQPHDEQTEGDRA